MQSIQLALQILLLVMQVIGGFIDAAEVLFPESGKGKEKLAIVREMIRTAVGATEEMGAAFDRMWPTIEVLITKLVAARNAIGAFKKQ